MTTETRSDNARSRQTRRAGEPSRAEKNLLVVAGCCQLATLVITWPLWQARESPPNLPLVSFLPDFSLGWVMVASVIVALLLPRYGIAIHWAALIAACVLDQFRLSPQFFGIAMLMFACTGASGRWVCRCYLAALWLWAGLHKLLSPDWMGHTSWSLVQQAGLDPEGISRALAIVVAIIELSLGLLTIFRPSWAAKLCVVVHLGIVLFLSPLVAGINESVIPWNIIIVLVGYWVLSQADRDSAAAGQGEQRWQRALLAILLLVPIGFYFGWVDRCFCHVLYSDNLPRGQIIGKEGVARVRGWRRLAVPFPAERRLYLQYFARTAKPGDKMHVYDPRPMLADQYFVMRDLGTTTEPVAIAADDFFSSQPGEVVGIALDRKRSLFALDRAGVQMTRDKEAMIESIVFTTENFDRRLLRELVGLQNLKHLDLSGTDVQDGDLSELKPLRNLMSLRLKRTRVTTAGLKQVQDLPHLYYVEHESTMATKDRID